MLVTHRQHVLDVGYLQELAMQVLRHLLGVNYSTTQARVRETSSSVTQQTTRSLSVWLARRELVKVATSTTGYFYVQKFIRLCGQPFEPLLLTSQLPHKISFSYCSCDMSFH